MSARNVPVRPPACAFVPPVLVMDSLLQALSGNGAQAGFPVPNLNQGAPARLPPPTAAGYAFEAGQAFQRAVTEYGAAMAAMSMSCAFKKKSEMEAQGKPLVGAGEELPGKKDAGDHVEWKSEKVDRRVTDQWDLDKKNIRHYEKTQQMQTQDHKEVVDLTHDSSQGDTRPKAKAMPVKLGRMGGWDFFGPDTGSEKYQNWDYYWEDARYSADGGWQPEGPTSHQRTVCPPPPPVPTYGSDGKPLV